MDEYWEIPKNSGINFCRNFVRISQKNLGKDSCRNHRDPLREILRIQSTKISERAPAIREYLRKKLLISEEILGKPQRESTQETLVEHRENIKENFENNSQHD